MSDEKQGYTDSHPAKKAPTKWIFDDHSEKSTEFQVIDILTDIRNILVIIAILLVIF